MNSQMEPNETINYRDAPLFRCAALLEYQMDRFVLWFLGEKSSLHCTPETKGDLQTFPHLIRKDVLEALLPSSTPRAARQALHQIRLLLENLSIDLELFSVTGPMPKAPDEDDALNDFLAEYRQVIKNDFDPAVPYGESLGEIILHLDQWLGTPHIFLSIRILLTLIEQMRSLLRQQLEQLPEGAATPSDPFEARMAKLRKIQREARKAEEPPPPTCPACGRPMILRTAKSGPSVGRKFWGCSGYPACKAILEIGKD